MGSNPLIGLPPALLEKLCCELADGALSYRVSEAALAKAVPELPPEASSYLSEMAGKGWSGTQLGDFMAAILEAGASRARETHLFDLVISGPEHQAVPTRDTAAVYRELIESAESRVMLASFAIYNGREIFQPLVDRMNECPEMRIDLYLDIPRNRNDTTLAGQLVAAYRHDFTTKQWPAGPLPTLYHHKPSLEADWKIRASMHAKVIVVDRKRALVTSANLTKAAQSKNIEVGTLIESSTHSARLADYFEGLREAGIFAEF